MKKPVFSIIIPVYNVEKYVKRCIESVINQDFEDYEIILVNDGSTDSSLEICKQYTNNSHVTIISKENEGPSSARNCGMQCSCGKYIVFLDSDDSIAPGSLRQLYEVTKTYDSDLFCINAKTVNGGNTQDEHYNLPTKK